MSLTNEQRSVYLIILNATMILRSVGKTLKGDKDGLKHFKVTVFSEVENLTSQMESGCLREDFILHSIERVSDECGISFGQSQKAINVLLKYHYFLNERHIDKTMKRVLHCPLDSKILEELGITESLAGIDEKRYEEIQQSIVGVRINFDKKWDRQHLEAEGLWKEGL